MSGYSIRPGKLITTNEAKYTLKQHTRPCSDCPFRRDAVPGWLGGSSAHDWVNAVHGEARVECHTVLNWQCAGTAIYRANVCKVPREPSQLVLPADKGTVFASADGFLAHHLGIER